MKKRVVIISIFGVAMVGGVEKVVEQLIEALRDEYEVSLLTLPQKGLLGSVIRRHRLLRSLAIAAFPLVSWAWARWRAGRRGLVISHGYNSLGLGGDLAFSHGCWKAYITLHPQRVGLFSFLMTMYEHCAAQCARRMICVSDYAAQHVRQYYGVPAGKIIVLPNAVNADVYSPYDPEATVCSGHKPLRIVFIGRLGPRKGADYLAELCAAAPQADVEITICSQTPPDEQTRRRFAGCRILCACGPEQLRAEYNRADLYLLPSRFEGFELTTLEALCCGTPALLNNVGSRPTLERLHCPGLFKLEDAPSPLAAVQMAAQRFAGMRRGPLAAWTRSRFDEKIMKENFRRICREAMELR